MAEEIVKKDTLSIYSRVYFPTKNGGEVTKLSPPHRLIGTLSDLDKDTGRFGVRVQSDRPLNSNELVDEIHEFYTIPRDTGDDYNGNESTESDESNQMCRFKPEFWNVLDNPVVGNFYATYIEDLNKVVRVKLLWKNLQKDRTFSTEISTMKVLLIDYGFQTEVPENSLVELAHGFHKYPYHTAFGLACQLPDDQLLCASKLPTLHGFEVGQEVEIILLSQEEPCLAVVGALSSRSYIIHRGSLSTGLDSTAAEAFQKACSLLSLEKNPAKAWAPDVPLQYQNWTLVTVLSSDNPTAVGVRDVLDALRFCYLTESINRNYNQMHYRTHMAIEPEMICSGSAVIAYVESMKWYIRGTVISCYPGHCNVEALDIPDTVFRGVSIEHVFYPSSILLDIPPLCSYAICIEDTEPERVVSYSRDAVKALPPGSVAALKLSLESVIAEMKNHRTKTVSDYFAHEVEVVEEPGLTDPPQFSVPWAGNDF